MRQSQGDCGEPAGLSALARSHGIYSGCPFEVVHDNARWTPRYSGNPVPTPIPNPNLALVLVRH